MLDVLWGDSALRLTYGKTLVLPGRIKVRVVNIAAGGIYEVPLGMSLLPARERSLAMGVCSLCTFADTIHEFGAACFCGSE